MDRAELKRLAMYRLNFTRCYVVNTSLVNFADRFGMSYGQAMCIEQQRRLPSMATRTLIEAIRMDPELVERAAAKAREVYGNAIK